MKRIAPTVVGEFFGTALLVCVVVGSGIMGTLLSTDRGVALLINAVSTVLALAVLVAVLAPISGAHLNPVVTVIELVKRNIAPTQALLMVVAQVSGAIAGAVIAHSMFELPLLNEGTHERFNLGSGIGEVVATAGLVVVIHVFAARNRVQEIPLVVAAWIGSAYFFTSSTSFANPAVTVGRMFTDTFAGIAPSAVLPFIIAQTLGAIVGVSATFAINHASISSDQSNDNAGEKNA